MNRHIKTILVLFIISITFVKCNKENEDNNLLYARINIGDIEYRLTENQSDIKATITFDSNPNNYSIGCSILDEKSYIEGTFNKSINSIDISFNNYTINDISTGKYNFYNDIYNGDTIKKGITIRWMSTNAWNELMTAYKLTEDYAYCISHSSKKICEEFTKDYYQYFLSSNIIQSDSYFEVTKVLQKSFEVWNPNCDPTDFLVDELIIEGKYKCDLLSILDSTQIKTISGDFRIHLPNVEKRLYCN